MAPSFLLRRDQPDISTFHPFHPIHSRNFTFREWVKLLLQFDLITDIIPQVYSTLISEFPTLHQREYYLYSSFFK